MLGYQGPHPCAPPVPPRTPPPPLQRPKMFRGCWCQGLHLGTTRAAMHHRCKQTGFWRTAEGRGASNSESFWVVMLAISILGDVWMILGDVG